MRFLDSILEKAEQTLSLMSPEKTAVSTQTPTTKRKNGKISFIIFEV